MIVAPRASLLWKPSPALTYSSVPVPRTEHRSGLRADERGVVRSRVRRLTSVDVEAIPIHARAGERAKPGRPLRLVLGESAGARLKHRVLPDRFQRPARDRVIQADVRDVVVAKLNADRILDSPARPATEPPVTQSCARDEAMIGLAELIAVLRVVEEVSEVGEQVQVVREAERRQLRARVVSRALPFERSAVAVRIAAIRRVDRPEPIERSIVYGARRNLVGRVPDAAVPHPREREAVLRVAAAVADEAVDLPEAVRLVPRPVVVLHFERGEQTALRRSPGTRPRARGRSPHRRRRRGRSDAPGCSCS